MFLIERALLHIELWSCTDVEGKKEKIKKTLKIESSDGSPLIRSA